MSLSSLGYLLPNQCLALLGGDIKIDGGIVTALGGDIEISGIKEGIVNLNLNNGKSTYNVSSYGNISISNNSLIDVSGSPNGSIDMHGDNLSILNGSILVSQNYGQIEGGTINLFSNELTLDDGSAANFLDFNSVVTAIISRSYSSGSSSSINIETNNFNLYNGAYIETENYDVGNAGNINIDASNVSNLVGISGYAQLGAVIGLASRSIGTGTGGDINFTGNMLNVSNSLTFSTSSFGPGTGGNLSLNVNKLSLFSGASLGSFAFDSGKAGNTLINANQISVDGASSELLTPSVINSATFGSGDAGKLTINTGALSVTDGGRVDTSTLNSGAAGDLTINAKSIIVSGTNSLTGNPSDIDSSASILSPFVQSEFGVPPVPTGKTGNLTLTANELAVYKGGFIAATNDGPGDAGTLSIKAGKVILRGGDFLASTQGGNGGKIIVSTNAFASQDGTITASAKGNGNGGDVTFTFPGGIGVGDSQSFITADAYNGFGGVVDVTAQYFQFPRGNITANSQRGASYNGTVNINAANFSAIPRILANIPSVKNLTPLSCANYQGVAKVKNHSEFSPEDTADPVYFVDSKPQQIYYKDIRSGKILPMPEQTVWMKDNGDGTGSALSLADVQNINESFLKSQCLPATQAASKT